MLRGWRGCCAYNCNKSATCHCVGYANTIEFKSFNSNNIWPRSEFHTIHFYRTNGQNTSSTNSVSTHSPGSYDQKVKIANGVAIPVVLLGLVLLGFLVYKRRKNQKTLREEDPTSQDIGSPQEDSQPYLQQKAELEAEGKRKHELEAQERRYEIGNEGERYELPVEEGDLMVRSRQELRGEEHSRELEVPR